MDPRCLVLTESVSSENLNTVWGMPSWCAWIIIAIFLFVSAIFSASENAYSNCNKYHFKVLANKGNFTAKLVTNLVDKFDNTLITVLVGNNIVQTLMSFLSAILFYNLCEIYNLGNGVEAILSTVVMAFLVYIVSDTCPKILSKAIPNRMACILAYPVTLTYYLLFPIIIIFKSFLWLVHKIFKIQDENLLSKEDLMHSVNVAINDEDTDLEEDEKKENLFENDEKELIDNAFKFDTLKVSNVYTNKEKVLSLNINKLTLDKLNKVISNTDYSRIPIYDDDESNVIGILVVKKYFEEYSIDPHLEIRSILVKPIIIDINENIDDALETLKKEQTHLAIVFDKDVYCGIITMEDILEELVKDIDEKPIKRRLIIHE